MHQDLTQGSVMRSMLVFAVPMILGNLLQQCYNIADTLIVGQFLGKNALAAVGSSFSLMTFLTSILLGLCMGGSIFNDAPAFACACPMNWNLIKCSKWLSPYCAASTSKITSCKSVII